MSHKALCKPRVRPQAVARTASTKTRELGVLRETVRKILNHADSEITGVYNRYGHDTEKRKALDAWAKRLTVITSGLKVAVAKQPS